METVGILMWVLRKIHKHNKSVDNITFIVLDKKVIKQKNYCVVTKNVTTNIKI